MCFLHVKTIFRVNNTFKHYVSSLGMYLFGSMDQFERWRLELFKATVIKLILLLITDYNLFLEKYRQQVKLLPYEYKSYHIVSYPMVHRKNSWVTKNVFVLKSCFCSILRVQNKMCQ